MTRTVNRANAQTRTRRTTTQVMIPEDRASKRWTSEEDERLIRQIRAFPQNLHKCFLIVGEELGRSDKAVQAHWYTVLSKRPEALCFATISSKHLSKNRKNGMGEPIAASLWQRFLRLFHL